MKIKFLKTIFLLLFVINSTFSLEFSNDLTKSSKNLLIRQHKAFLRNQELSRKNEKTESGLKIISEPKIVSSNLNACDPGYSGPNCSPVCSNKIPLKAHDGLNLGDAIELKSSMECSDNFTIPVDNYVVDLIIMVYSLSLSAKPLAYLYTANGMEILPTDENLNEPDLYQARFAQVTRINGPGIYTVQIKSLNTAPCSYQIIGATTAIFDAGFVENVRDDNILVDIYEQFNVLKEPKINIPNYLVAKPTGIVFPGMTTNVAFYNGDDLQYPQQTISPRYNCSASLMSSLYVCTRNDFYLAKFRGYDDQGSNFQRVYAFGCGGNGTPQPPTTPSTPPDQCLNGGTKLTFGINNVTCLCTQYYTGYQCEIKLCFNDGFLNIDNQCECQPGYSGEHCTDVTCPNPINGDYKLNSKSLVFVIRTSTSMSSIIKSIQDTAKEIIGYTQFFNPSYYKSYVLVGFANGKLTKMQEYSDANQFQTDLNNLQLIDANNCSDIVYGGLSAAVTTDSVKTFKRSPIFLFSDVLPNDPQDRPALFSSLSDYEGQIFTILPYSSSSKCPINIHDPNLRELRRLAQFTHGHVTQLNVNDLKDMIYNLAISITNMASLAMNDFVDQCSNSAKYTSFFVDDTTGYVYVTATGKSLTLTVYNTKNQIVNPVISKNAGDMWIYQYNNLVKGNYLLYITSDLNSPCQFRVLGDSNLKLFIGTSNLLNSDMTSKAPIYNELTNIVAHINHINYERPSEVYAEVVVWSNDFFTGNRTVLYAANGMFRDSCDYHFLFERFKCARRDSLFYISVYLTDRIGYTVQRIRSSYCSTPNLIPTSPDGCQNGGVIDHNTQNATCSCPTGWTGNLCQTIICQNEGTSMHNYCQCRAGFAGKFCEIISCTSTSYEDFSPYRRKLVFFVHNSRTTAAMIQSMNKQLSQTIQDITQQHSRFIDEYVFYEFADNGMSQVSRTKNATQFVTDFHNFAAQNLQNQKVSCENLQVLEALYLYLMFTQNKYDLIYVFMRGIMDTRSPILFDEVQTLLEASQAQINFVNADAYPCGHPLTDPGPQYMWSLATISGGQVFIVSLPNAAGAMKTIPLQFRNGLIHEKYVDDCTSPNGINFYFPVDSETQSVTVLIDADLNRDVTYTYPDGTTDQNLVSTVYADYGVSARLDQIIAPCDGLYRPFESRCWLFVPYAATWSDARDYCINEGGILATVFDNATEEFLYGRAGKVDFWIGLNDKNSNGNWVWDQGNGQDALPLTTFTNWGSGQPNTNAGNCVIDSSTGNWRVADCGQTKAFSCVKHKYDADYQPNGPSANGIYQGIWSVNIQSYSGGCYVSVWGQSGIQVYTEYGKNIHSDFGGTFPTAGNVTNYMITHISGLSSFTGQDTGSLEYAHFYPDKSNTQLTQVQKYNARDINSCKHQYVTPGFNCPGYAYNVLHTGVDRYGYTFQRITPALCYQTPNDTCLNGGVFYDNKCVCPPHYGGEICQMPFCVHGRLTANYANCDCSRTDFTGDFCEIPLCINGTASAPQETTQNKTLIIILDGSYTNGMKGVLTNLDTILNNIITNTTTLFPGWITNYIGVVAYDSARNGSVVSNKISETNPTTFRNELVDTVTTANYISQQNGRSLFSALTLALAGADVKERSIVYVITAGNAEDYQKLDPLSDMVSFTHPQVNMFIIGDQGAPGNTSYRDPAVESLFDFSYTTGGGFYQVANYSSLLSFWYTQIATIYNSYTVASNAYHDCSSHTIHVQIGALNTKLIVDLYSMIPNNVIVNDLQGNNYPIQNVKKTNTNYLFTVDPLNGQSSMSPGIYTISINSTNPINHPFCNLAVRSISQQKTWIAYTQDLGYDNGQHSNIANLSPINPPIRNAIVVENTFGTPQYVQVYDLTDRTLLWASPLIARQNCQYGYISQQDFICPTASFTVALDGVDDNGHPYRRIQVSHCKGFPHNSTGHNGEYNSISHLKFGELY